MGVQLTVFPLLLRYHVYSTHYHGVPVRVVSIPVITAVISQDFSLLLWFPADYCGNIAVVKYITGYCSFVMTDDGRVCLNTAVNC